MIAKVDGLPVEIQVRTELQDQWAQIFERLGDSWGRAIRYGGQPEQIEGSPDRNRMREDVMQRMADLSTQIARLEEGHLDFVDWPLDPAIRSVDEMDPELQNLAKLSNEYIEALLASEKIARLLLSTISELIEAEGVER